MLEVLLRKNGQELYSVKFATDEVTLIGLMKMLFDLEKHSGAISDFRSANQQALSVGLTTDQTGEPASISPARTPLLPRGTPFKPSTEVSDARRKKKARYAGRIWRPHDLNPNMRGTLLAMHSIGKPVDQASELDGLLESNPSVRLPEERRIDMIRFYLRELDDRGLIFVNEQGQRELTETGRQLAIKIKTLSENQRLGSAKPSSSSPF